MSPAALDPDLATAAAAAISAISSSLRAGSVARSAAAQSPSFKWARCQGLAGHELRYAASGGVTGGGAASGDMTGGGWPAGRDRWRGGHWGCDR